MNLVPLLPGRTIDPRLRDEFNRLMDLQYERIRDFLILHYKLTTRDDSELWRYCASMEVPASLTRKIDLFRHDGIIEKYREGLFTPTSWLSVLVGQGLVPENYSPVADAISEEKLISQLSDFRENIRDRADELLPHDRFIDRYCAADRTP
jgi:tryptophan halogenase